MKRVTVFLLAFVVTLISFSKVMGQCSDAECLECRSLESNISIAQSNNPPATFLLTITPTSEEIDNEIIAGFIRQEIGNRGINPSIDLTIKGQSNPLPSMVSRLQVLIAGITPAAAAKYTAEQQKQLIIAGIKKQDSQATPPKTTDTLFAGLVYNGITRLNAMAKDPLSGRPSQAITTLRTQTKDKIIAARKLEILTTCQARSRVLDCPGRCNATNCWRGTLALPESPTLHNDVRTTLPVFSATDLWDKADKDQLGIIGSDYRGEEELGSAPFERETSGLTLECLSSLGLSLSTIKTLLAVGPMQFLGNLNFWYAQKKVEGVPGTALRRKHTLAGKLSEIGMADERCIYEDHDVNLEIYPSPNYLYLLKKGHAPELTTKSSLGGLNNCPPFSRVEGEIDAPDKVKNRLIDMLNTTDKKVCVYGPWIYDEGHCDHPEIHPTEQIWWSEPLGTGRVYYCNLICDDSKRFWWRHQMDGTKIKPWAAPPITGTFAIAFEATIGKPAKKFEVFNLEDNNVVVYPGSNKTYNLVYEGNTLVSFVPGNDAFKVSFENVGFYQGKEKVRGFLVIETSVGTCTQTGTEKLYGNPATLIKFPAGTDPNTIPEIYEELFFKKVAGHYMFSINQSDYK